MILNICYLLVARGGSKGLSQKNLRQINGKSLMAWKSAGVRAFDPDARIVCSTDDLQIIKEAQTLGLEVPFIRPRELASDTATTNDVVKHALDFLEDEGRRYDAVFLLEPSSPFTEARYYAEALEMYAEQEASLVAGIRETYPNRIFTHCLQPDHSIRLYCESANALADTRRQAMPVEYTVNGSCYLFSTEMFKRTGRIYGDPARSYGLMMDRWNSVEIEDLNGLLEAQFAVEHGVVKWPLVIN